MFGVQKENGHQEGGGNSNLRLKERVGVKWVLRVWTRGSWYSQ